MMVIDVLVIIGALAVVVAVAAEDRARMGESKKRLGGLLCAFLLIERVEDKRERVESVNLVW